MKHQPEHRQGADGPQHQRQAAIAGRAGEGVRGLRAELLQLQPVVADEEGQRLHVANGGAGLDVQAHWRCARSSVARPATNATQRSRAEAAL